MIDDPTLTTRVASLEAEGRPPELDARTFGVIGDGVTDDTGALQTALTVAGGASPNGGTVTLPPGVYLTSATIVIPEFVTLRGVGRKSPRIETSADFPTSTPIVQLGDTVGGVTQVQGCRVENLELYSTVAGSIGVYSETINEKSGAFWVLVRAVTGGYQVDNSGTGSPKHFAFDHCQAIISGNVGDEFGYKIHSAPAGASLAHCTANAANTMVYGFGIHGENITISDCHVENATDGVRVGLDLAGNSPGCSIYNLDGPNDGVTVTNLVYLNDDEARSFTVIGLSKNQATNCLVYEAESLTITKSFIALFSVGSNATVADRAVLYPDGDTRFDGGVEIGGDLTATIPWELMVDIGDLASTGEKYSFQYNIGSVITLTEVVASVVSATTTGTITLDVEKSGTSVFSTTLTIDQGETTSKDAATPPVIDGVQTLGNSNAAITIDADGVGDGTATGCKVILKGTRSAS